jgi:uncharacterized protein (TIGR02611 family)
MATSEQSDRSSQFMTTLRFLARSGWRIGVLVVGGVIVVAGLVMIVTPGPGVLLIAAGLGILATEFAWARRLRDKALDSAKRGARRIRGKSGDSVDPKTG